MKLSEIFIDVGDIEAALCQMFNMEDFHIIGIQEIPDENGHVIRDDDTHIVACLVGSETKGRDEEEVDMGLPYPQLEYKHFEAQNDESEDIHER